MRNKRDKTTFCRAVQFVSQDTSSSFDPMQTLRDSVRLPTRRLLVLDHAAADACVNATGPACRCRYLWPLLPEAVSDDQQQRFMIARTVVVQPPFLVCDKATLALDMSVQGSILNLLKDYCETTGAEIVFFFHSLPATAFIANNLVVINRSEVVEHDPTRQVLL